MRPSALAKGQERAVGRAKGLATSTVEEVSTIHLEESVMTQPTTKSRERIQRLVDLYTSKTGTTTHPDGEITEIVILGLASHLDQLKKPLCPCRFLSGQERGDQASHLDMSL